MSQQLFTNTKSIFFKKNFIDFKKIIIFPKNETRGLTRNACLKKFKKLITVHSKDVPVKTYSPLLLKKILLGSNQQSQSALDYRLLSTFLRQIHPSYLPHLKHAVKMFLKIFLTQNSEKSTFGVKELQFFRKAYGVLSNSLSCLKQRKILFRCITLLLREYTDYSESVANNVLKDAREKFIITYVICLTKSIEITQTTNRYLKFAMLSDNSHIKVTPQNQLYKKLIGLSIKKGLKSKALKLVQEALQLTSTTLKVSTSFVLLKMLNRLKLSLELKTVRKRVRKTKKKMFHVVPCPARKKREIFLIAKSLLSPVFKKSQKLSSVKRLSQEFITLLEAKKKSVAFKTKIATIQTALKNRSNKHFRW